MGTGLLHWTAHVRALHLQEKWILNYLNTRKAIWKHALDPWFCRTGLGRGAEGPFSLRCRTLRYIGDIPHGYLGGKSWIFWPTPTPFTAMCHRPRIHQGVRSSALRGV
eukprot:scaffold221261_cov46-Tisochrysis_lutea.AAC.1